MLLLTVLRKLAARAGPVRSAEICTCMPAPPAGTLERRIGISVKNSAARYAPKPTYVPDHSKFTLPIITIGLVAEMPVDLLEKIGDNGVQCRVCGKTFTVARNGRRHVREIHLQATEIFTCHLCQRTFHRERSLRIHVKTCGQPIKTVDIKTDQ